MIEGLWTIKFITNLNTWGGGVIVLTEAKRILGGDVGYYYIGTYEIANKTIKGQVDIIQFDTQCMSVFGDISNFKLEFQGTLNDDSFVANATSPSFPGYQLRIEGHKKESL